MNFARFSGFQRKARSTRGTSSAALVVALCSVGAVGCGHSEPAPREPRADASPRREKKSAQTIRASAEIGGLNEEDVEKVFTKSQPSLVRCLNKGAQRIEFIGGKVSFFIKVGADGSVEHAHLEHSSLGDRTTEKCMLDALRAKQFPKPVGGEHGLARKSYDFDPPADVRPANDWDAEQLDKGLKKLADKLESCKLGNSGRFEATAYVSTSGEVLGAGVTPPDETGEASVDCLVETLMTATFPSPGSWPAKVTFKL